MSKAVSTKKKPQTSAPAARAKTVGGKIAPRATALTGDEGAYLRKLKGKAERGAAMTPAQKADLKDLEARRVARNLYSAQLRKKAAAPAKPAAKAKPAPAATPAEATVQAVAEQAMTLSKAELLGAIKASLLIASNSAERLGLHIALKLAEKLAD